MAVILEQESSSAKNDYEQTSRREVIMRINQVMSRLGLLPLPLPMPISYNEKSFMDYCVRKYIEDYDFEDD